MDNKIDRYFREMIIAKARVYDLYFKHDKEPTNQELKAKIIMLESELKKVIAQRQELKLQIAELRARLDKARREL